MQWGLNKQSISRIIAVLKKYTEIEEVVLYGSRAKGNYKSGSDIDLTIKGNGLNLNVLNKICLDLDDLLLPYTFDISLYDQIKESDLIDHIQRVGQILYSKKAADYQ